MQIVVLMAAPSGCCTRPPQQPAAWSTSCSPVTQSGKAGELCLALATWTAVGVDPDKGAQLGDRLQRQLAHAYQRWLSSASGADQKIAFL